VREHQWQFDKVRENYTYTSLQTTEDIDANGQVQKTETVEDQEFFVNGHVIERTVKKNGSPLNDHDQQREAERVSALVEKAKRTPPDQPLVIHATNISRLPEINHHSRAGNHGRAQSPARNLAPPTNYAIARRDGVVSPDLPCNQYDAMATGIARSEAVVRP
jgi:hypothetical protein